MTTTTYTCWDESGEHVEIAATSAEEAAREYVLGGWPDTEETTWWAHIHVEDPDGCVEVVRVPVHPEEPRCTSADGHDWQTPHDLVGGSPENPGVYGSGGGVKLHEACVRCGCGRVTDTWATDPADGRQGLEAITYEPHRYELA